MRHLGEGYIKRIHVNQHIIKSNRKNGADEPALTCQLSTGPLRARNVDIKGPSRLVTGDKPLSCGARIWIETKSEVELS